MNLHCTSLIVLGLSYFHTEVCGHPHGGPGGGGFGPGPGHGPDCAGCIVQCVGHMLSELCGAIIEAASHGHYEGPSGSKSTYVERA